MELERLVSRIKERILATLEVEGFRPGKISLWLKFVQFGSMDGTPVETAISPVHRVVFTAASIDELVEQVAENLVLQVFGAETQVVRELPNLIVKLFDHKAMIPMDGAPPLDAPDQVFVKATVYRYDPGLWEQLFGRRETQADQA